MAIGRRAILVLWVIGIAVLIGLTVWSGASLVGQALLSVGWGAALVVIVRFVVVSGAGVAWWLLFPPVMRPTLWSCVLSRFIREGTNAILPLTQVGGDIIGARCLVLYGVKASVSAASVIVDVLVQASTQFVFALVGLVMLIAMGGNGMVVRTGAIGAAIAIPALVAFFFAQRQGGQRILKGLLALVGGGPEWRAFSAIDDLYAQLNTFYARREGLVLASLLDLASWFVGAIEVWIVLSFMGYAVTYGEAVIIESLMHAARGAAFAVPSALGVQEGGLIVLCAIFAIPPEAALALSLVKRIPDLVIGVCGVTAWQALEGRHYFGARHRRDSSAS